MRFQCQPPGVIAWHEMIHAMGRISGSPFIGPVLFGRDISVGTGRGVVLVVIFMRTVWDPGHYRRIHPDA